MPKEKKKELQKKLEMEMRMMQKKEKRKMGQMTRETKDLLGRAKALLDLLGLLGLLVVHLVLPAVAMKRKRTGIEDKAEKQEEGHLGEMKLTKLLTNQIFH